MSYHRFQNFSEILQGDLTCKLREGIYSKDFEDRNCNCNENSKVNGLCAYNSQCRRSCVVYKVISKICDAVYIGNTQQTFKARMNAHFNDVQQLVKNGKFSDSFARHFAQHFSKKPSPRQQPIGENLWATRMHSLHGGETEHFRFHEKKVCQSNESCSEIYGACHHKTRFHRFARH